MTNGPYIFKINGMVHHRIGSLVPNIGNRPEYAQLYIYDTDNELDHRVNLFRKEAREEDESAGHHQLSSLSLHRPHCEPDRIIVESLMRMLKEGSDHDRRYSLHVASELATLIVGDLSVDTCRFDVIVQSKTTNTFKISPFLPLSDVLPVDT
jgi:hypothetical protein